MKKIAFASLLILISVAIVSPAFAQKKEKKKKKEKTEAVQPVVKPVFVNQMDSVSYIIGADIAKNFKKNHIQVNQDYFWRGFNDAMADKDTLFTQAQIGECMGAWQKQMNEKRQAESKAAIEKNRKEGEAFLAENKTKPGVIVTPSGLQYIVIKEGQGDSPVDSDVVKVHYTGVLIDGTKFDSSRDRGTPAEFPVDGVIPGWTEALKLMKPGALYKIFIPSDLAYGDRGTGPIPEASTLIFDVELISIEKK